MPDTVRLELEYGDLEFEFEGPAEFARNDLVPLISALVEKLADFEIEFEEDEDDEEDEKAADGDEAVNGSAGKPTAV